MMFINIKPSNREYESLLIPRLVLEIIYFMELKRVMYEMVPPLIPKRDLKFECHGWRKVELRGL